eukprot:Rmarinus@m.3148
MARIETYAEFFLFYLGEHSLPMTRAFHYFGTILSMSVLIYLIQTSQPSLVPVALVCGYGPAWISHFFIERNKPATFKYPLWSFFSDFKMLFHFATGTLDPYLKKAGVHSA